MRVLSVSPNRIEELDLPEKMNLRQLLPVNDPARNFNFHQVQLTPIQWQSGSDLICEIVGAGRRVDPLQEDTDAMPTTAFVTVGYRLTIRFGEHTGMVLA